MGAFDKSPSSRRAWIEISSLGHPILTITSPSSRRAWIEIGNDRPSAGYCERSPSSRRAWIEIPENPAGANCRRPVALLAEGVDRNSGSGGGVIAADRGRPPRGGRG